MKRRKADQWQQPRYAFPPQRAQLYPMSGWTRAAKIAACSFAAFFMCGFFGSLIAAAIAAALDFVKASSSTGNVVLIGWIVVVVVAIPFVAVGFYREVSDDVD